jgi:rubrerythrin
MDNTSKQTSQHREARHMNDELRNSLLVYQRNEITEHHIYSRLARSVRSPENSAVLQRIADDELKHYHKWKEHTHQEVKPDRLKIWKYYLISRILGFTFGIKLMERGEESAQQNYGRLRDIVHDVDAIVSDENKHEQELIALLDEE